MTIDNLHDCDGCGKGLEHGDYIYCNTCYSELEDEITSLKNDIENLNNEIAELQIKLQEEKK